MSERFEPDSLKWLELHGQIQNLLAGYVDDVLEHEQNVMVEAHLAGCKACRDDVARQQALCQRLDMMQNVQIPESFHNNVDEFMSEAIHPTSQLHQYRGDILYSLRRQVDSIIELSFSRFSGWLVASILTVVIMTPSLMLSPKTQIPMINDVIAEYRQIGATDLPASRLPTDQLNAIVPAQWPHARVLSSWNTEVGGAPAKAFAVRSGHNILFLYHIPEAVMFRNPKVRQAIANTGSFHSQTKNMEVLALPIENAGLLVVGPNNALPSAEEIHLRTI